MTALEDAAIELHDHIWKYVGLTDDWPIHIGGDDAEVIELVRLMNQLRDRITESGYARMQYARK